MGARSVLAVVAAISLLLSTGSCGRAETSPGGRASKGSESGRAPRIVPTEREFDFGAIKQGAKVEHTFEVRNEGDADLVIERARGSCRCTAALVTQPVIPPGDKAEIRAIFDSMGRKGRVRKKIKVWSNDPVNPRITLALTGEISVDVAVEPPTIDFGQLLLKEKAVREFTVTVVDPAKVKVSAITVEGEKFSVESEKEKSEGGTACELSFLGTEEVGRFSSKVKIAFEGSEVSSIEVPVRGIVAGDLRYAKDIYFFKRGGAFLHRDVVITTRSGKSISIEGVSDPDKRLAFEILERSGSRVAVRARVANPKVASKDPSRHRFVIKTTDRAQPEVEISYVINGRERQI